MYTPKKYLNQEADFPKMFIQHYPFGLLISATDGEPLATHIPFLLEDESTLVGHIAKANSQIDTIAGQKVLAVFSGPHSYISPLLYNHKQHVPTWNYAAVHVYGICELIDDKSEILNSLRKLVNRFDPEWTPHHDALSEEFLNGMLKGLTAFKINITNIEATKKFSQNKSADEIERVAAHLSQSDDYSARDLARWMNRE